MRHGTRLLTLLTATAGALGLTAAPASALELTTPTLPAPLPPVQLPVSASVSGGTGGAPIDVTANAPGSTIGVEIPGVEVPGVTQPPTLPGTPIPPAPVPPLTGAIAPPAQSDPHPAPASPYPGVSPAPRVGVAPEVPSPSPSLRFPSAWVRPLPAPTKEAPVAHVSAAVTARAADDLLSKLATISARVLLWAALAAIAFVLQMLMSSALAQRRRPARVS